MRQYSLFLFLTINIILEINSREVKKSSIFTAIGSLHTLNNLAFWASKEEEIHRALSFRRNEIQREILLIFRYLYKYENTRIFRGLETIQSIRSNYNSINSSVLCPTSEDLLVSNLALLGTQNIVGLPPNKVFQGNTFDTHFGGHLKLSQCSDLGVLALENSNFVQAVEWLEFAQKQSTMPDDLLQSLLRVAIKLHNQKRDKVLQRNSFDQDVFNYFVDPVTASYINRWQVRNFFLESPVYGNDTNEWVNMMALCSGQTLLPQKIRSQLKCYLDKNRHPYFRLNPLKTEQLSEYPLILQFYDILGEETINDYYKARGTLHVSTVIGGNVTARQSLWIRNSAGSLPKMEQHGKFIEKIQNKSEILTGLLLTDRAEGIQTVEYTYGRYFRSHLDPFSRPGQALNRDVKDAAKYGDRIATLLYYLDAPVEGGGTSFNHVGINAKPVRGSAVFWINMYRNGTVRPDVSHAACPVLHGHKTVINQWIRYNSNFETFKCSLNQWQ